VGSSFHGNALYGSQNQSCGSKFVSLANGEQNCYPHSTTIFARTLKDTWSLQNLQRSWRQKGLRF